MPYPAFLRLGRRERELLAAIERFPVWSWDLRDYSGLKSLNTRKALLSLEKKGILKREGTILRKA